MTMLHTYTRPLNMVETRTLFVCVACPGPKGILCILMHALVCVHGEINNSHESGACSMQVPENCPLVYCVLMSVAAQLGYPGGVPQLLHTHARVRYVLRVTARSLTHAQPFTHSHQAHALRGG